jgi:nicotinamide-nucleotide amidase
MNAEIITIGDEILIGQIVDTNSAWMAKELNTIGIDIVQISSIKDEKEQIVNALNEAKLRADIIFITGGLGPTSDDITRPTLASYFNLDLVLNDEALDNIRTILTKRNIPIGKNNEMQAWLPKGAIVIQNARGTAPGMWIENKGTIYVSMPGVPYEMKSMMQLSVLKKLGEDFNLPFISHKTITVVNVPESILSTRLFEFERSLPKFVKLAYLPNLNTVRLRLSAKGNKKATLDKTIDQLLRQLREVLHVDISAESDETPALSLANALIEGKLKIGTAESCTGGYVAHQLTAIPGSSTFFEGSIISYSYDVKESLLGVNHQDMLLKGAVSEAVVVQMATSLKNQFNIDYAIAISGIAGPGGGTSTKPVGTVWICIKSNETLVTRLFHFDGDRLQIIERTSNMAMELTRRLIKNLPLPDSI